MLQTLANPAWMQSGFIGLKGLRYLLDQFIKSFGKHPDAILEPMQDQIAKSPEEELAIWVNGTNVEVRPSPAENLQDHLGKHAIHLRDPMIRTILKPAGIRKLMAHMAETQQLLQMQNIAQTMQARGGGPGGGGPAIAGPQLANAQQGALAPQQGPTQRMLATGEPGP